MKLKNILFLSLFLCSAVLTSCKEEEVQPFTGETGVNFLGYRSDTGTWSSNPTFLSKDINFFDSLKMDKFPLEVLEVPMRIAIEGLTSSKDLKVTFKTESVEGQPLANIELPASATVKAGMNYAEFTVKLLAPGSDQPTKAARITVDYANSDLVAGTKDRQSFTFTVKDVAPKNYQNQVLEPMFIETFEKHLGKYGPIKHRFLVLAAGGNEKFVLAVAYSALVPQQPMNGLPGLLPDFRKALQEYNAKHSTPLKEADGTLVELPAE